MRLVYLGSPQAAVAPLRALHDAGHQIVLVVSGADKRRGRGKTVTPTPVKAAALELGLQVTDELSQVLEVEADLGVVVAYGRIIPADMLGHLRMINLHFSLLPRWRGAAPVERAILAGDATTGVCVMDVEEGLDTGGVHARAELAIGETDTAADLRERLSEIGSQLLVTTLARDLGESVPQAEDGVTYAEKIRIDDRRLDSSMSTDEFLRVVRVGDAWTEFRGKRLKVAEARAVDGPIGGTSDGVAGSPGEFVSATTLATVDGAVELVRVQPEGKAVMAAADWARGANPVGERIDL